MWVETEYISFPTGTKPLFTILEERVCFSQLAILNFKKCLSFQIYILDTKLITA